MKFIHMADVHLGMTPDAACSWSKDRTHDLWNTFNRVIDRCNEEEIDLLLIAGDLFHRQPRLRELKEVNYSFEKLMKTTVILIAGNHDYLGVNSYFESFEWNSNVIFLKGDELEVVYLETLETTVYGFSYHKRDITVPLLQGVRIHNGTGQHILIAHGGDSKNLPFDKKELSEAGFDYVALGHIHKPERIMANIAYAGSLEPLDKTEIGDHGYIYGELEGHQLNLQFVAIACLKYIQKEIEIHSDMTFQAIKDRVEAFISQEGERNIYRFLLHGLRDPDMNVDIDYLKQLGKVIEVVDETSPDYDFESLLQQNRNNLIGSYIENIRKAEYEDEVLDKALYYGIHAILHAKE